MKTKKRSLQISRHSSSNLFLFSKEIYFKTYPKGTTEISSFLRSRQKIRLKTRSEHALWRAYIPLNLGICIALPQNKHGGGHMND